MLSSHFWMKKKKKIGCRNAYFWFDIVKNTVLNTPQCILCFIHVNAKIERMQWSKILVPRLRMLQRFHHTITNENNVWIFFPALGQKSFMLHDTGMEIESISVRQMTCRSQIETYNANPSVIFRIDGNRYGTWIHVFFSSFFVANIFYAYWIEKI